MPMELLPYQMWQSYAYRKQYYCKECINRRIERGIYTFPVAKINLMTDIRSRWIFEREDVYQVCDDENVHHAADIILKVRDRNNFKPWRI